MDVLPKKDEDNDLEESATKSDLTQVPSDTKPVEDVPEPNQTEQTAAEDNATTFMQNIAAYKAELDDDFHKFEDSLKQGTRDTAFDTMNWDDLQHQFEEDMKVRILEEQRIMNDFNSRIRQFMLWMQVSNEKETDRALKRLRTRVAFVQSSESQLTEKQQHYEKVLEAFQNAMSLLGNMQRRK